MAAVRGAGARGRSPGLVRLPRATRLTAVSRGRPCSTSWRARIPSCECWLRQQGNRLWQGHRPRQFHLGHDYFCKRKPKEDSAKSLGVQPAGAVKEDEEAGCMDDKKIDYLLE